MEKMSDKKQIPDFFFKFKFNMAHKAVETTCNINNAFGPGTTIEHTVQWWFKKFCEGVESLDNKCSGWSLEVDSDQLGAIIKSDPLTTT